jgi:hypothetical protein
MQLKFLALLVTGGALAACGQSDSGNSNATANATANAATQQPKKAAYCFFKPEEMKGWAASRDKDGNVKLKGKGHVKDPRYQAVLGPATVAGSTADIAPTIAPNTGYESPGDWWDMSTVIPNSAAVTAVTVRCGDKVAAQLTVAPPKGKSAQPGTG